MKTNVWNIKEILNIPSRVSNISSKGGTSSDYSSLTDSQFLLGSQFWPENSQTLSQDVSFSSRSTKHNSEEGNEFRVSSNYHAKPYLFGGDTETHSATNSKPAICVLDKFEEDKKRAKENSESENIHHEFLKLHKSLEKAIHLLENLNDGGETTQKGLVEGINTLTKTIKESMVSVWDGLTPKIDAVISKLNSQSQTLKEMEDREAKLVTATKDLSSHLQDLQRNMDSLKMEHGQEQTVLAEMQSLLTTTVEAQSRMAVSRPTQMVNSEVQTSPGLVERFCVVSEEKRVFQGVRLCGPSATCLLAKPSEPAVGLTSSSKQTNTCYDQTVPTRAALRPLPTNQEGHVMNMASDGMSESLWQQAFCTQALEAPGDGGIVSGSALREPRGEYAFRQGVLRSSCIVDPMQEDSQMIAITDKPQCRVVSARKKGKASTLTHIGPQTVRPNKRPRRKTRALIPQTVSTVYRGSGQGNVLCDSRADDDDEDEGEDEELSPLYQPKNEVSCENIQPSFKLKQNKEVGMQNGSETQHMWDMWSCKANRVQGLLISDKVNSKTVGKAKTKAKPRVHQKAQEGLWNLFNFDDSD